MARASLCYGTRFDTLGQPMQECISPTYTEYFGGFTYK